MKKSQIIKTIDIAPEQQSKLEHIDLALWISTEDNAIGNASLFINLHIEGKKTRLKVDQVAITNIKVSLLNNHIILSDYKKVSCITLELESSCTNTKVDSTHMHLEFRKVRTTRNKAA